MPILDAIDVGMIIEATAEIEMIVGEIIVIETIETTTTAETAAAIEIATEMIDTIATGIVAIAGMIVDSFGHGAIVGGLFDS